MLDQRFRHTRIDVVMRHLIADAIGAPAKREFRQIAGADHQPAMVVGEPEQVVRPQPSLHVLEGHVIDRLAPRRTDARDRCSICIAAGRMSSFANDTPSDRISASALPFGVLAGGKTRHRVGEDVGARQAQQIHRLRRRRSERASSRARRRRQSPRASTPVARRRCIRPETWML